MLDIEKPLRNLPKHAWKYHVKTCYTFPMDIHGHARPEWLGKNQASLLSPLVPFSPQSTLQIREMEAALPPQNFFLPSFCCGRVVWAFTMTERPPVDSGRPWSQCRSSLFAQDKLIFTTCRTPERRHFTDPLVPNLSCERRGRRLRAAPVRGLRPGSAPASATAKVASYAFVSVRAGSDELMPNLL